MPMAVPTKCASPACRESTIKPIHCSTQKVAIDAVDGPAVFAHLVTYRCGRCGHTWAVQGYSSDVSRWPVSESGGEPVGIRSSIRAW